MVCQYLNNDCFPNMGVKYGNKMFLKIGNKMFLKIGNKMFLKIWEQNVPEIFLGGNGCIQSLLQLLGQSWLNDWFYIIFKRFVQRLGEQSFVFNDFSSTIFCQSLCQSLCQFFEKSWKINDLSKNFFQKNVFKNFWQCLLRFSIYHILYNPLFLQHFLQSIVNSNTYCNALKQ